MAESIDVGRIPTPKRYYMSGQHGTIHGGQHGTIHGVVSFTPPAEIISLPPAASFGPAYDRTTQAPVAIESARELRRRITLEDE